MLVWLKAFSMKKMFVFSLQEYYECFWVVHFNAFALLLVLFDVFFEETPNLMDKGEENQWDGRERRTLQKKLKNTINK